MFQPSKALKLSFQCDFVTWIRINTKLQFAVLPHRTAFDWKESVATLSLSVIILYKYIISCTGHVKETLWKSCAENLGSGISRSQTTRSDTALGIVRYHTFFNDNKTMHATIRNRNNLKLYFCLKWTILIWIFIISDQSWINSRAMDLKRIKDEEKLDLCKKYFYGKDLVTLLRTFYDIPGIRPNLL